MLHTDTHRMRSGGAFTREFCFLEARSANIMEIRFARETQTRILQREPASPLPPWAYSDFRLCFLACSKSASVPLLPALEGPHGGRLNRGPRGRTWTTGGRGRTRDWDGGRPVRRAASPVRARQPPGTRRKRTPWVWGPGCRCSVFVLRWQGPRAWGLTVVCCLEGGGELMSFGNKTGRPFPTPPSGDARLGRPACSWHRGDGGELGSGREQ